MEQKCVVGTKVIVVEEVRNCSIGKSAFPGFFFSQVSSFLISLCFQVGSNVTREMHAVYANQCKIQQLYQLCGKTQALYSRYVDQQPHTLYQSHLLYIQVYTCFLFSTYQCIYQCLF